MNSSWSYRSLYYYFGLSHFFWEASHNKTNWNVEKNTNNSGIHTWSCCWSHIRRREKSVTYQFSHLSALWHFWTKAGIASHLHSSTLLFQLSSPFPSCCLTIQWCGQKGSCTTNIRNSVNFTLCCLPKNPGPRFGDLASQASFQTPTTLLIPHTFLPACHQQRTLLYSSFRSSQKTS